MTQIKLILDAEFTTLDDVNDTPRLISFGLVSDDGEHSFYGELTDGWKPSQCTNFVHDEVLPHLDKLNLYTSLGGQFVRAPKSVVAGQLAIWLQSLGDVRIWTDAPQYDWPLLKGLLHAMWPPHVANDYGYLTLPDDDNFTMAFEDQYLIQDLIKHHALHDALVLQSMVKLGLIDLV